MPVDLASIAAVGIIFIVVFFFYYKRRMDFTALVSTVVVGFVVLFSVGVLWLTVMIGFFVIGNLATRFGYSAKKTLMVEERERRFYNVWGNGSSAMFFAVVYLFTQTPALLVAFLAAMAAATADTLSTEIGPVYVRYPRLITNISRRVEAGTNGGVSAEGVIIGAAGAFAISLIPLAWGQPLLVLGIGTLCGILGNTIDSLLGATIEDDKYFNKHVVNMLATLFAGFMGLVLGMLLL